MNKLTTLGRLNILIFFCSAILLPIAIINKLAVVSYLSFLVLVIWCSSLLSAKKVLVDKLANTILHDINFSLSAEADSYSTALQHYTFSKLWYTQILGIYYSTEQTYPLTLIRFSLVKKEGKESISCSYIGCEFITKLQHEPVQLYDKNNPIQPSPKQDIQLESSEFNNLFNLYSSKPSAPFYFFDPDTMNDLIDLSNNSGISINIESVGNRILIYMDDAEFFNMIDYTVTTNEILNRQINPEKIKQYQTDMRHFITRIQRIFVSLDYKLKIN